MGWDQHRTRKGGGIGLRRKAEQDGGLSAGEAKPDLVQSGVAAQDALDGPEQPATQAAARQCPGHGVVVRLGQPTRRVHGQVKLVHQDEAGHRASFRRGSRDQREGAGLSQPNVASGPAAWQ